MGATFTRPESIAILVALVLAVLTRFVLPESSKHSAREPVVLLVLHLVARASLLLLDRQDLGGRIVQLLALVLLMASIGRSAVLITLEAAGGRIGRPIPRIFRDIIQAIVYVVLLLVGLRSAGVEPGSILTTSALLTAAIALSLQETLGNLVAGLAIQWQRPFDVDDWIQFDTDIKHIGKVLEINWRATKVLTLDDVEVVVPNATLAKASVTNFTKPTRSSRRSIYICIPGDVPPHIVRDAILGALPGTPGVLADPPPTVVLNQFIDGNNEFWIRFHTDRFEKRDIVDGSVRERIVYSLIRAAVPGAAPQRHVRLREVTAESQTHEASQAVVDRERALERVDFLRGLSEEQRRRLAHSSRIQGYGAGEDVVKQGQSTAEMFIVHSGKVDVVKEVDGKATNVASLGPGEFFGEMALMTGEQRMATVRASSPATLISVEQAAMRALLEDSPELAGAISRAMAERQEAAASSMRAAQIAAQQNVEARSTQLLGRIRRFFSL